MPDIFNRNTDTFGGSFAADQAKLTFPAISGGGADAGLLVQNLSMQYMQNVTRLYEVGSAAIYYVGGRTQGQASVSRVVGPRTIAAAFYQTYGDVCNAGSNILHFAMQTGCPGNTGFSQAAYTARYAVITAVGVAVESQQVLINENLAMMFASFYYG